MLYKIQISNFQSHENTSLDLHSGVNVICGRTDGGKSAILRAVRWAIENRPQGEEFRSWWGGDTTVRLITTDGIEATRGKSKSSNWYDLDDNEKKALHFEAFGSSVPNQITETLKMSDVNFQWQHDRAFLLSESAPEVARRLNKVARIEDIDAATTRGEAEKRAANAAAEVGRQAIADLQVELSSLPDLKPAEELLAKLEAADESLRTSTYAINMLAGLRDRTEQLTNELAELPDAAKLIDVCAKLQDRASSLSDLQFSVDGLTELLTLIENARSRAESLSRTADLDVTILSAVVEKIGIASADLMTLESLVESYDEVASSLTNKEEELTALVRTWEELAPDACPLCGKPGFADSLECPRHDAGANPSGHPSLGRKRCAGAVSEHYEPS